MEEQKQVHEGPQKNVMFTVTKWLVAVMGVSILLALAGVILGAINFVSPTVYPGWILATWLVVDILLVVIIAGHTALYAFTTSDSDTQTIIAIAGIIGFIVAAWLLFVKHFAWISAAMLILLIVFTVIDVLAITSND